MRRIPTVKQLISTKVFDSISAYTNEVGSDKIIAFISMLCNCTDKQAIKIYSLYKDKMLIETNTWVRCRVCSEPFKAYPDDFNGHNDPHAEAYCGYHCATGG